MKTVIGLLMIIVSPAAFGQVLKCVDQNGKLVTYASVCPAGTMAQNTGIRNSPGIAPAPAASGSSLAERDAEFRKRRTEQQEAAAKAEKEAAQAAERQRACDDARAYLKSLEAGQRIARTDPRTGERVFLEGQDYAREIAAARDVVTANCK